MAHANPRSRKGPSHNKAPRSQPRGNALRATLHALVGRPYADVLASLTKQGLLSGDLKRDSTELEAAGLAVKTSLKNGKMRAHLQKTVVPLDESSCSWYVHPKTTLVQPNEALAERKKQAQHLRQQREKEALSRRRELPDNHQAHKVDGQWWLVQLRELSDQPTFDVLVGRNVSRSRHYDLENLYGRKHVYGHAKRALVYRELRVLGLS